MKGDFSRNTFNRNNVYYSVRMQQGRVLLDADWNEQVDQLNLRLATAIRHLVGDHGGIGDSFRIELAESVPNRDADSDSDQPLPSLAVYPGQYYVGGLLCELGSSRPLPLTDLPTPFHWQAHLEQILSAHDMAIVYLDVWEEHLTALDQPDLLEPALSGQDTTTRTQLAWQIRLLALPEGLPDGVSPADGVLPEALPAWQAHTQPDRPVLTITRGSVTENSLYRIEIHDIGDEITWKWSRNNATVAYVLSAVAWIEGDGVEQPPRDRLRATVSRTLTATAALAGKPVLEITCAAWRANGRPGIPATLVSEPDTGSHPVLDLQLAEAITEADLQMLQHDARLLRWDHVAQGAMLPLQTGTPLALDHGIEVTFPESDRYRPGDYWQIPMRISDPVGAVVNVPWQGPRHSFAPLALLYYDAGWDVCDLRREYARLVDVFDQISHLRTDLVATRQALADLQAETDREDEEQEDEIAALQQAVQELRDRLNQFAGRQNGRHVRTFRSEEELDVGEVVASSGERDEYIVRARRDAAPIGVVGPRPDDYQRDEYNVVLSGPALCRVYGPVQPGDLLEIGEKPGHLSPASRWTRWFQPERIFARAMDIATTAEYHLIEVFVLPAPD